MKHNIKLFIFGVETFIIILIVSMMLFTRIYNGSFFSIYHQFDKQKHLVLKKKITNNDYIFIYEIGEPVFFEKNQLKISFSNSIYTTDIEINNNGKPIRKKDIQVIQNKNYIIIKKKNFEFSIEK